MGNSESSSEKYTGYALILGYENFISYTKREGNDVDVQRLRNLLKAMRFNIDVHLDLTAEDTKLKIKEVAEDEKYYTYPCLVVIILTHGELQGILCASDINFYTSDIWGPLKVGPNFKNKTKVLFFQACRGLQRERNMKIGGTPTDHKPKVKYTSVLPRLPHDPTFFIAFSTEENLTSIRNGHFGSWYIETLFKELQSMVNNGGTITPIELTTLLTRVNYMIVNGRNGCHAQTPCFISFLPSQLVLPELKHPILDIATNLSIAGPSTSASPDCATADLFTQIDEDCGCVADAAGNTSNLKIIPSYYAWENRKSGRALIFYTQPLENEAKEMQDTLRSIKFQVEKALIVGDNFIQILKDASTNEDLANENCLLVVVLAPITSNNSNVHNLKPYQISQRYEDSHIAGQNLSDVWMHFIASNCIALQEKPKMFFYLDNLDSADCPTGSIATSNTATTHSDLVNDHLDFLHVFGYGKAYFKALRFHLMQGYLNQTSMEAILSKSRSDAMEDWMRSSSGEIVNMSRIPYHKSTLSRLLCLEQIVLPLWNPTAQSKALIPGMQEMYNTIDTNLENIKTQTDNICENHKREEHDEADNAQALVPYCHDEELNSQIQNLRSFEKTSVTVLKCGTTMLSGIGILMDNLAQVTGPTLEGVVSRLCQTTAEILPEIGTTVDNIEEHINTSQHIQAAESIGELFAKLAPVYTSIFSETMKRK